MEYEDYVIVAGRLARELKKLNVDIIIALAHIPFAGGPLLVENIPEIDLVLMGHNHFWNYRKINDVNIIEGDVNLATLSIIDISYYRNEKVTLYEEKVTKIIPDNNTPKDPEMETIVQKYLSLMGKELNEVIGNNTVTLECRNNYIRSRETNLGDFVSDVIREWGMSVYESNYPFISIFNSGGLRWNKEMFPGNLTKGDLIALMPFENDIVIVELTGKQLRDILENGLSYLPAPDGEFIQISGFHLYINCYFNSEPPGGTCDPAGSRVRNITFYNGTAITNNQILVMAIPDYYIGTPLFESVNIVIDEDSGIGDIELFMGVISKQSPLSPKMDNRIIPLKR